MVWIGTDDGAIQVTTNDGKTWQNVTPAAVTAWGRVTMMEASHFDVNTAYASVDRHQLQDFEPYIYRTRDMGKTWQAITKGLPAGVYVHTIKEDPKRQGLLFAGTERGAFISMNDGDLWQPLQLNLPVTSVRDFEIYGNDLIVGTHGRGIWVIDDISPLRQLDDAVLAADAHLFEPASVVALVPPDDNGTPFQKDEPHAENPVEGAVIYYRLKTPASGPITLEILDAGGAVVGTVPAKEKAEVAARPKGDGIPKISPLWNRLPEPPLSTAAGMHRVVWPTVEAGSDDPAASDDARAPRFHTGTFSARLTVGGKIYTQRFEVLPDPEQR
jgi:hypothetical protein